jgi:DNA-binding transcriptional LysR family regulator
MQLKKLEDAVGRTVLTRGPRHLELTPAGLELLAYARRMLELHAQARAALRGPTISGRVNLGVPDDYAAAYLTPVLRSFSTRHASVEITLVCEQSTLLIPKLTRGELDLAVVTRDKPQRGTLLFAEPLVWAGAAQHEAWRRDPLPIAVYEPGSLARRDALASLTALKRRYRIVYNSSSLVGHIAAVESGLAVAVLTRCSMPAHLLLLQQKHGLPELPTLQVALLRSKASKGSSAVDAMHEQVLHTLRRAA